jgi:hypothetical protein
VTVIGAGDEIEVLAGSKAIMVTLAGADTHSNYGKNRQ